MRGVGGVDDLDLAHRVGEARGGELFADIGLAPHDQRPTHAAALPRHRRPQHARVVAFGEDHPRLRLAGAGMDALHDRGGRVHPRLERLDVGLHVDDRAPGDACVHPGPGDGRWDHVDQPRVEGRRDDVVAAELLCFAVSGGDVFVDLLGTPLVPVVYRIDMRDPNSLFVSQAFRMRNRDLVYVSNAPFTEVQKVLSVFSAAITPVASAAATATYVR